MTRFLSLISALTLMLTLQACSTASDFSMKHIASSGSVFASSVGKSKGHYKVGIPYKIKGKRYTPKERFHHKEKGIASWYGPGFHGKKTANGEIFDENGMTAAHKTLQLPCLAKVTNLNNGRTIIVRVNDRGPYAHGRILDLSKKAASELGFIKQGTARIKLEVLTAESMALAKASKAKRNTLGIEHLANAGHRDSVLAELAPAAPAPVKHPVQIENDIVDDYDVATLQTRTPPQLFTEEPPPTEQPLTMEDILPQSEIIGEPVDIVSDSVDVIPEQKVASNIADATNLYVQAGSYESFENARTVQGQVHSFGRSDIRPVMIYGQKYYRVRVGPMQSKAEADKVQQALITHGKSDARIVIEH